MKKSLVQKLFDKFVYRSTKKPEHYVRVDAPKTLQEFRQVQYNNWCKRFGVYNGSYLPTNHRDLLHKVWLDITHPNGRKHKPDITEYIRKSNHQRVAHHDEQDAFDKHYHWYNPNSKNNDDYYLDRYGSPCKKGKPQTHLAPLDKNYNMRKKK